MKFGTLSTGLGDIITFTSILKHFPMQHTMQLLPEIERFSIIFDGIANVEITNNINVLPDICSSDAHYSIQKLRNFFGPDADTCNILPHILHFNLQSHKKAIEIVGGMNKPVVFNPFCSKGWAHLRNLPDELIHNIILDLKSKGVNIIGCFSSKNSKEVKGLDKIVYDLDLSVYIHLLRITGMYVGCNTGDMHLAAGLGCLIDCYNPRNASGFNSNNWCYNHSTINNYFW